VPVTLKIRTGWCPVTRNGVEIARIAEDCGIQLLNVHGRTRDCRFKGAAEYDTIAAIKDAVSIAVIANGDIDSPVKAAWVLEHTGADGLMIGRAAQGRSWIFKEIEQYLAPGRQNASMNLYQKSQVIESHIKNCIVSMVK
jgi:tRNA-dihydrouridine synthase B|tara:strand:- start:1040 stop:1459 length:420 start_codon:yes stop_codon:yes gene_type:complete